MSRIPRNALLQAVAAVKAMDDKQKELVADELFRIQPNLLGSALVLARLGISMDKVGFALDMLFICFRAMKEPVPGMVAIELERMTEEVQLAQLRSEAEDRHQLALNAKPADDVSAFEIGIKLMPSVVRKGVRARRSDAKQELDADTILRKESVDPLPSPANPTTP